MVGTKGYICFKDNPAKIKDYYNKPKTVNNLDELYDLYFKFTDCQIKKTNQQVKNLRKVNPEIPLVYATRQDFYKWAIGRGVCPYTIITPESNYWFETICIFDGEMGLTLPGKYEDIPMLFFQALAIVRNESAKIREESDANKKNSSSS